MKFLNTHLEESNFRQLCSWNSSESELFRNIAWKNFGVECLGVFLGRLVQCFGNTIQIMPRRTPRRVSWRALYCTPPCSCGPYRSTENWSYIRWKQPVWTRCLFWFSGMFLDFTNGHVSQEGRKIYFRFFFYFSVTLRSNLQEYHNCFLQNHAHLIN